MADMDDFEVHEVTPTKPTPTPDRLSLEEPVQATRTEIQAEVEEAVKTPPIYERPRFASSDLIPRRRAELIPPEPYEKLRFVMWANPSDGEINARVKSTTNFAEFMACFILEWNMVDEEGEPLEITAANMEVFPKDLWDWLTQEYGQLRQRPLVPPKDDTTDKNQTPRPMSRNSNRSLNGSTA